MQTFIFILLRIKFIALLFSVSFLFPPLSIAQVSLEWENQFDFENSSDTPIKMLIDNNGNIYNPGTSYNSATKDNIVYFKIISNGLQEWYKDISNPSYDHLADFAIDANNNLYSTGYYGNIYFNPGFVQKINSNGTLLWVDTTEFETKSIAIDDSNNVYILYSDFAVGIIKYDSLGEVKFNVRNDSTLNGYFILPSLITLDDENNIYVVGTSSFGLDDEFMLKKFSPNGNFLWSVTYNPTEDADQPLFVSIDEYSNIYLYGVTGGGNPGNGVALVKYDSSGNFLWDQQILAPISVAIGLSVTKNSEPVISGISFLNSKLTHSVTHYTEDGEIIWSYYPDDTVNFGNLSGSMIVDKDDEVYYTGCTKGFGIGNSSDILLLKLDSNGNLLWKTKYNSSSNKIDIPVDMALDFNNDILITGYTYDTLTNNDILTLKYSQPTQISEIDLGKSINIFPNPFYSTATIQLYDINSKNPIELQWCDLPGRLIKTENIHSKNNYTITREGIENGMYILKLISENKIIGTTKIVVQ